MIQNSKELFQKLSAVDTLPEKYQLTQNKDGDTVLKIIGEKSFYMHSKYSPRAEAQSFAQRNRQEDCNYLVYGLGLGYHILALLENLGGDNKIYIFESDIYLVRCALEDVQIKALLESEQIEFYFSDNQVALLEDFGKILSKEDIKVIIYEPAVRLNPQLQLDLTAEILRLGAGKGSGRDGDTICFMKAQSAYDALEVFMGELAQGFQEQGYNVIYALPGAGGVPKEIMDSMARLACICTFNGIGLDLHNSRNENLFDLAGLPVISIYVDHPFYHGHRLKQSPQKAISTFVDLCNLPYMNRFYPSLRTEFFPHGGSASRQEWAEIKNGERDIDILFTGTLGRSFELEVFLSSLDSRIRGFAAELAEYTLKSRNLPIEACVEAVVRNQGGNQTEEYLLRINNTLGVQVDDFIRQHQRHKVVQAICGSGLELYCCGNGWESSGLTSYPNFKFTGATSYQDALELYRRSKVVINFMPEYKQGSHERVFAAMLHGAVCVSGVNQYLTGIFGHGEDILFFQEGDLSGLIECLKRVLSDEHYRLTLAENAFMKAARSHTWVRRAQELCQRFIV